MRPNISVERVECPWLARGTQLGRPERLHLSQYRTNALRGGLPVRTAPNVATSARVLGGAVVLVVSACVVLHSVTDDATIADLWYQAVLVGASVGAWIGAER